VCATVAGRLEARCAAPDSPAAWQDPKPRPCHGLLALSDSSLAHVVAPTLAVVLTWVLVGLVLVGCGRLIRRAFLWAVGGSPAGGFLVADLWIGLAGLVAYLQIWNLFLAVTWVAWAVPAGFAAAGLLSTLALPALPRATRRLAAAAALCAIGILWLANEALGRSGDYDLGLYHLNMIEYAKKYATIPGLGNLQVRLGSGDAHLLFVALLDHGHWAGAGWHLADGLLASMLLVEIASRLRRPGDDASVFTRRVALLLVPATIVALGTKLPAYRLSSPNLDFAAYVLVVVGMLYLADCVENGYRPVPAFASVTTLALASSTRPLYWIMTGFAVGIVALGARASGERAHRELVSLGALCVLALTLLVGWMARQAVLSGYPFFPLTLAGLPVDWRLPVSVVSAENRIDDAWARWPGADPRIVLSSWHWLRASWLPSVARSPDTLAPAMLLGCLFPSLAGPRAGDAERANRTRPMLALAVPSLATLAVWFAIAPAPRFALAPLWLVAIALAAWALPTATRATPLLLAGGLTAAAALALLGVSGHVGWMAPAALGSGVVLCGLARLSGGGDIGPVLAGAVLLTAALAPVGLLADRGVFDPVVANGRGPFGTPLEPVPAVVGFETASGLRLHELSRGNQCFELLLCAAPPIDAGLRLRGARVSDGFSEARPSADGSAERRPVTR
jgi:hypothetical protein